MRTVFAALVFVSLVFPALAQKKPASSPAKTPPAGQRHTAFVSGRILDENENPLAGVSVTILGRQSGLITTDSGTFRIKAPADKAFALVFSFTGYKSEQRNFLLNEKEEESIVVRLERSDNALQQVVVSDQRDRQESGLIKINPKNAINIPTPIGGIESLLKVFVGSNNELTSQYSVHGGNYDENLTYINDFEVFRPYLVSNAQQEGLSIINPELTHSVNFYTGGFQARYGDKISSALDIQYRKPGGFGGSAYAGLLEQGLHLEGTGANNKFTWLVGLRNRTNSSLLSSQETQGTYAPSSSDLQAQLTWQLTPRTQLELLGTLSQTRFHLIPQSSQLTSSIFSPYYTANLGLDTWFDGQEKDQYEANLLGLTLTQQVTRRLKLKWMASRFEDKEQQSYDITGVYIFGDRDFDKSSATFGQITNPLGAGAYQNFARDHLDIDVYNVTHKGYLALNHHYLQWGLSAERQLVVSHLDEWQYQDSAGYSLPYTPGVPSISNVVKGDQNPNITRTTGYIQDNLLFRDSGRFTLQGGVRYNYNDLNKEFLVSPRLGASWRPRYATKDIVYRAAVGIYDQPPFFREMLRPDGTLNTRLKAQRSWQVTAGFDQNFHMGDRPFRFTTEAYYKSMTRVDPYDINNVHIQYFAQNDAKAYATGIEFRLTGELVKDAESYLSLGFMRSMEKIDTFYYTYTLDSLHHPLDSTRTRMGWVRRPSDRLFNLGLFLQDYLATNKNIKAYLNFLYGSNLPFNIPGNLRYRNALTIDPYIRVDVGFSALLLDSEKSNRRSHSPFRNFENIWATLEVFNLIDRANTISYMLIKDFSNTTYAIPERLTPRLLNLKLVGTF
ncbi:carboxypeptidase-like regulatory domain-containing protein [Puia dinghuensis]|uniref:TonB-dependent receptor n=1 Tax=Puia dinghuensis TaxID=1792502 RepID=A0A8J2XS07_9BACT|nr:carboxypeptidase-like regulatory domain-containing protein [Puia dinghuensis]GGA91154.1 TonB-dependent receptor [Puia dinghuensis]